jgi:hypothetical protein
MINAAITIIYSPKTMFHVVHPCLVFLPRRPLVRRPLDLPRTRPESAVGTSPRPLLHPATPPRVTARRTNLFNGEKREKKEARSKKKEQIRKLFLTGFDPDP